MRFVFASDSLKGTISSARAAAILEEEATRVFSGVSCTRLAVADGGEGTVDAVVASLGGSRIDATVEDPLGRPVEAIYGMLPGNRAIIEMAAASGLPLLTHAERNPMLTSTYGTGQLVLHALRNGAAEVTLAIGGMGAMRALGVRFLDDAGGELQGTGADLGRVASIDLSGLDTLVSRASFRLLCDVDNPLLGPRGATRVFSSQKGATSEQVEELERGMASYVRVLERTLRRAADKPGDGAAGGLGPPLPWGGVSSGHRLGPRCRRAWPGTSRRQSLRHRRGSRRRAVGSRQGGLGRGSALQEGGRALRSSSGRHGPRSLGPHGLGGGCARAHGHRLR